MSLKEKNKKRFYKSLFSISVILLILFAFLYTREVYTNKSKMNLTDDLISFVQYQKLENQLDVLNEIKGIDQQLLFKDNYENALSKLEYLKSSLDSDSDFITSINERITYAKNLLDEEKQDELSRINLRNELLKQEKLIDSLNKKTDSITLAFNKNTLTNKRKVDSLNVILKKKETLLSRKETIKVLTFKNDNGNLIRYLGETKDDMANGNGVGIWNTSSIYRGEWKNNKRHGLGEFEWSDGQKYEGEFVEGIRTGEGIYYWPSGEKYVGEFKDNKRDGQGTFYDPDGNVKFEGKWKNDKLQVN